MIIDGRNLLPVRLFARRRARHLRLLMTASVVLRGYGYPELGDEIAVLASRVRDGDLVFDAEREGC